MTPLGPAPPPITGGRFEYSRVPTHRDDQAYRDALRRELGPAAPPWL